MRKWNIILLFCFFCLSLCACNPYDVNDLKAAREEAYDEGYAVGFDEGRGEPRIGSYEEGYADGYHDAKVVLDNEPSYDSGYEDGYDAGWAECCEEYGILEDLP